MGNKIYVWDTHFFDINEGKVHSTGSTVNQRIKASDPLKALKRVVSGLGSTYVATVYTPRQTPLVRFLSREAATLNDSLLESPLDPHSLLNALERCEVTFETEIIKIDGLDIPYHPARIERRQKEGWVPIEIMS